MHRGAKVFVIIPALNEERAIGRVLEDIPDFVDQVIVVDNGSTDQTVAVARAGGALVVSEPERGYGAACLMGIANAAAADIIVFMDGDYSDHGSEMASLVDPIVLGAADMVLGSRVLGEREAGSLTPQQQFGNWLATTLMRVIWGARFTDLGPYRAIRASALADLGMRDRNYGWTVEMQIRAARAGLAFAEVPVSYRRRIGQSKVSGTVKGTILAGIKILTVIGRFALTEGAGRARAKLRAS
ncbi:MAG: glycosyltransferase family 2 protein [Hyphomicrobiaceae bacterium]